MPEKNDNLPTSDHYDLLRQEAGALKPEVDLGIRENIGEMLAVVANNEFFGGHLPRQLNINEVANYLKQVIVFVEKDALDAIGKNITEATEQELRYSGGYLDVENNLIAIGVPDENRVRNIQNYFGEDKMNEWVGERDISPEDLIRWSLVIERTLHESMHVMQSPTELDQMDMRQRAFSECAMVYFTEQIMEYMGLPVLPEVSGSTNALRKKEYIKLRAELGWDEETIKDVFMGNRPRISISSMRRGVINNPDFEKQRKYDQTKRKILEYFDEEKIEKLNI